jgi:L-asparaginase
MGCYETSSQLLDIGVISGYDLTLEAALAKLYWLLGQNNNKESISSKIQKCYRGELTANISNRSPSEINYFLE